MERGREGEGWGGGMGMGMGWDGMGGRGFVDQFGEKKSWGRGSGGVGGREKGREKERNE